MLKLCILLWFGCYAATCSKIREHEIKSTRNISSELKTELEEVDPEELDEEEHPVILIEEESLSNNDSSTAQNDPEAPQWTNKRKMEKILHAEPAGNTVTFRCTAQGEPPLTAKWFKDDEFITKDKRIGGYKFRARNQIVALNSVVLSDIGTYRCEISNKHGMIHHSYILDVAERSATRPLLQIEGPRNRTAFVGQNVTIVCKVYSDPHPHIQWLKQEVNGSVENKQAAKLIKKAGVNTTNDDMQTLTLKNVSYADQGEYTCLAGNAIGISHVSAFLKVLPVPDPTVRQQPISNKTNYLIYGFVSLCSIVVLTLFLYLYKQRKNTKDVPRLVPIEDPDKIPRMTKMEEPLMFIGSGQTWSKMCPVDHVIKVEADLQWELKREDVILKEPIDEGFFGQVYKAVLVKTKNGQKAEVEAAVKTLKPTSISKKDTFDLLSEMDQMKRVGKHKNIVNLLGVCTQNGPLWLVTEYAQQGNLRDYLRRNRPLDMQYHLVDPKAPAARSEPLSQKDLMSAAYQVARGMEYLSQKKCIHRDLAARNVLVTNDYVMKIADFGLARDIKRNDYYRKHTRGHLPYKWMALEAMTDNFFTHATDVWSFGVLLWEIFSLGGSPYPGVKTHDLVRLLRQGQRLDHPQFASLELYRLMRDCWEELPQRRPKFRQLVEDLDRMLAESSSLDYIDLSLPLEAKFSNTDSEESGIDDEGSTSRDSANATGEETDSVFERGGDAVLALSDFDNEENLLLPNGNHVMVNGHARMQSDV